MVHATSIIGAQVGLARSFLDLDPERAANPQDAIRRMSWAKANVFEEVARGLGFENQGEFAKKFTDVAMEHISGLVNPGQGFVHRTVERDNFSPEGGKNLGTVQGR